VRVDVSIFGSHFSREQDAFDNKQADNGVNQPFFARISARAA
jgi:hypothetical protein